MLLEAGFFPQRGFPRVYLVPHFVGMLSIFFHVDFNYMIYYELCENGYILCYKFLTSGIRAMILLL